MRTKPGHIKCDGECGRLAHHAHRRDYVYYECDECYLLSDDEFFTKRRKRLERKEQNNG